MLRILLSISTFMLSMWRIKTERVAIASKCLALAKAMAMVNMKVELTTGRIATFTLAMSGWQINEPAGDGAVVWTAFGKQSGDVIWSIASKTAMKKAA